MFQTILKNVIDGQPCKNRTLLTIDEDDTHLLVEFCCEHTGGYDTPYGRYNDPIYRGEAVEFFICVKGEELYFEFDLAPNNTLFNARILYYQKYGTFANTIKEKFVLHSVEEKGSEYVAKMKIPFDEIGGKEQKFLFNAYRIVSVGEKKEFQAFNPTGEINFHRRDKFVELKRKDEK